MKKITIAILSFILFSFTTIAQRYAVIDSKYILGKIPEYIEAQTKLDQFSILWQQEIDQKQTALDKMNKDFEAEQIMLPDNLKKKREDEIFNKEKELRDLQKKRFGYEGDLFKKRQELIQPIQDKVFDAVQKLAQTRSYDFIFDKASGGAVMLYTNPQYDVSEEVIKKLGI